MASQHFKPSPGPSLASFPHIPCTRQLQHELSYAHVSRALPFPYSKYPFPRGYPLMSSHPPSVRPGNASSTNYFSILPQSVSGAPLWCVLFSGFLQPISLFLVISIISHIFYEQLEGRAWLVFLKAFLTLSTGPDTQYTLSGQYLVSVC